MTSVDEKKVPPPAFAKKDAESLRWLRRGVEPIDPAKRSQWSVNVPIYDPDTAYKVCELYAVKGYLVKYIIGKEAVVIAVQSANCSCGANYTDFKLGQPRFTAAAK